MKNVEKKLATAMMFFFSSFSHSVYSDDSHLFLLAVDRRTLSVIYLFTKYNCSMTHSFNFISSDKISYGKEIKMRNLKSTINNKK